MTPPPAADPLHRPTPVSWAAAFARDAGLGRPAIGWARDRHGRLVLWAALPAWALLFALPGVPLRAPADLPAVLSLLVVQPVLEEVTVRGLVQGLLLAWLGMRGIGWRGASLSAANLLATALFVLLHLEHQPWGWALAVALPSLVLGHLRERLGSVWPCVLLHATYNLGFAAIAWSTRLLA